MLAVEALKLHARPKAIRSPSASAALRLCVCNPVSPIFKLRPLEPALSMNDSGERASVDEHVHAPHAGELSRGLFNLLLYARLVADARDEDLPRNTNRRSPAADGRARHAQPLAMPVVAQSPLALARRRKQFAHGRTQRRAVVPDAARDGHEAVVAANLSASLPG